MKPNIAYFLCAAALAAVASGPVGAETDGPSEGPTHLPMQPHRNADGSFKHGLRGTIVTGSWAGYAVTAGSPYTSASATWQVPNVSYDGGSTPYGSEYVFNWIGIGGYGDSTLIQLGTESVVSTSGARSFYVWYELYPAVSQSIPHSVNAGDIITASLQCTAACSPDQVQTWTLTMTDETAQWTWTQSSQYQSSMASAEWIEEPPYYNTSFLPLADYVKTTFDPVFANAANPNLTLAANGIQMSGAWGQTSNPSGPGKRQRLQHVLGACSELHPMHRRILHDTAARDDRLAFRVSDKDQPRAGLDLDMEFHQRLLLHRRRVHRVRSLGQRRRLSERDNRVFGNLHRRGRPRHRDGHGDSSHAQNLPWKEVLVSTVA
jgi:hypothetical protein